MNRLSQAVVMGLLGGSVIKVTLSGMFLRYVKPGLRPLLLTAGVVLIVAAVAAVWFEFRPSTASDDDGHGHAHHEPRVGWLLLLPALALLLVAPPALGSFAAGLAGAVPVSPGSDYPPLPPGDPAPISLLDYATRALDDAGRSLAGRQLVLTGFVTPGPDGQPMLARMVLICCAADARPIKIGLAGDVPQGVAPDGWVRVIGTYSTELGKDPVDKAAVAYLQVASWQEIPEPNQPYA